MDKDIVKPLLDEALGDIGDDKPLTQAQATCYSAAVAVSVQIEMLDELTKLRTAVEAAASTLIRFQEIVEAYLDNTDQPAPAEGPTKNQHAQESK